MQNTVDAYGVDEKEVAVSVAYQTSGTISISDLQDISEEEFLANMEDELAALLGVHESQVEVEIVDGVVHYTVTSQSMAEAQAFQDLLAEESTATVLDTIISSEFPVSVTSMSVNDDIVADVQLTVDTTSAEVSLNAAADELQLTFENAGFTTTVQSKVHVTENFS